MEVSEHFSDDCLNTQDGCISRVDVGQQIRNMKQTGKLICQREGFLITDKVILVLGMLGLGSQR